MFNFKTTGNIVFRSNNNKMIIRFCSVYLFCYGLNHFSLTSLVLQGINALVAQASLLPLFVVLSYLLNKGLVFKPDTDRC
ncbi:MAG: hypothetical protein HQK59_15065 [Deltaproteobacteria bacterium]|nr:hypothetical protein [Deltaproteobacteria bacterium]